LPLGLCLAVSVLDRADIGVDRPKRTSRALPRGCPGPPRTHNSRITHPVTVDGVGYRPFLEVLVGGEGLVIAGSALVFCLLGVIMPSARRCATIADWSKTPLVPAGS